MNKADTRSTGMIRSAIGYRWGIGSGNGQGPINDDDRLERLNRMVQISSKSFKSWSIGESEKENDSTIIYSRARSALQIVRAEMAKPGIDVLLLPANTGRWEQLQGDSRYLTTIGGFATEVFTVFPREGDVTAYIFNRAAWWKQAQKWVTDVRDGRNRWGQNAIERITELGLQKGTIGISGFAGLFRAPEGIIPYSSVKAIQDAFPQAKIVNATEMMQEIRAVKSAEEVSMLERSAAIMEKTIEAMVENANPGVSEKELYGAMVHAMLANGGELPTLFFLSAGPGISNSSFVPTDYRIQKGDRLINEIEAKYAGYAAQAVCPVVIGQPTTSIKR